MNLVESIFSIIIFLLSAGLFIISYLQFKEKGFLFNNSYIYASKKERIIMNKKPYYRQSAIAFFLIAIMFLIISLEIILSWDWLFFVSIGISILLIIYAIISSVFIEKNKQCQKN